MKRATIVKGVAILVTAFLTSHASAGVPVSVVINGEVEFNQINGSPLGDANPGDAAQISFLVDSDSFTDGSSFPTRGYDIDVSSFLFSAGSATLGLEDPPVDSPLFVLRNDDPAVDGFFLGTNPDGFPNGVALSQTGIFGQFRANQSVTYTGGTLTSLDILDAVGFYDFTGLTVFGFTVDDGPFNAMGLIYSDMTISVVPEPGHFVLLLTGTLALLRYRRR